MTLQAVLFDLWGTLILDPPERSRPRQVWRAGEVQQVLLRYEVEVAFDVVDRSLQSAMAALGELQDSGVDVDSAGRATIFSEHFGRASGQTVPAEALAAIEQTITGIPNEHRPGLATGAVETLAAVKDAGLATALISNAGFTTSPALRSIIDDYGLTSYFDLLVFSDELRLAKPDRRMFERATEVLRVEAKASVYVGDSPHNDVFGAQSAGIFAVQIGRRTRDGITPEAQIDRLDELMPALRAHALIGPGGAATAGGERSIPAG